MRNEYIIAYDFGTSGVKAVLVDLKGRILSSTTAKYTLIVPRLGWAEQDTGEYWQAIIDSTRTLTEKSGTKAEQIAGLVFSTQSMGIIPVDENGEVLHHNITWVDGRAEEQARRVNNLLGAEILGAKDVICKLLWLKEEKPEIFNKAKYFMDVNCFLRYKATGLAAAELTGASSYGLDLEKNFWMEELYEGVGVGIDKLPPLVKSTDRVGGLTEKAAEELALNAGTPVFGGCDDVQAAAIGAGTMEEGKAHIYLGSSAWLCVTTKNVFDIIHGAATVKSADPEKNVIIGVTQSSGMTVDWTLEKLYREELDQGGEAAAFDCIEKEIQVIPPGSCKLLLTPWLYGEYCPVYSEHVRMTMFNLTNIHTRAHIMKAVYEGIGYNLRWIRENYEEDFGVKISGLRVIGGGAQSEHWMQIIADIMQVKVQALEEKRYAGALGAAVCAMIGLGIYEGFHKLDNIVRVKKEFLPDKENREIYDKLFAAYKGLYSALKEPYERI